MKAMLISEIFPPLHGGSGRWFWEVYTRLPRGDYIMAVGKHPNQEIFDKTHDLPIERINLSSTSWGIKSLKGLAFYFRCFWVLRTLIKKHQIKKLHCGRCLPEGFMAYLLKLFTGMPYLCYIHGEDIETAALSRELSWMVKRVLNNAEKLICNSHNTAGLVSSKWQTPSERIAVVHPGVDTNKFKPAPRSIEIREQLGWGDRPVILTVGRLQERKGHDMMIRAMPAIIEKMPSVLYAIIGNGDHKVFLNELVDRLGIQHSVSFMNEIDDQAMVKCYQQCDLFILPNRQVGNDIEGFGMVLVEAQACGKFVITGNSGGTAETLIQGETGVVVDCSTPENLAITVVELLSNLTRLEEGKEKARQHVENSFDWEKVVQMSLTEFSVSNTKK